MLQCENLKNSTILKEKSHITFICNRDEVNDLIKIIESSTINNFDEIIDTINTMKNTMIAIVGPPGVGKTRFSEQLKGVKMRYIE